MYRSTLWFLGGIAAASLAAGRSAASTIFAQYDPAIPYEQGTIYLDDSGDINNNDMAFNNPIVVGDPTAGPYAGITDLDYGYAEIISPFDPPADADQIVTIGSGGQITLKFSQPISITNGPAVGVFTSAGLFDTNYPTGTATNPAQTLEQQSAVVSVSPDGVQWYNVGFQSLNIPENYYSNATSAYQFPAPDPAQVADFSQPFTGALSSFNGEDYSQILQTLNGSAGGTWLYLSACGLSQISYIQFSEPAGQVPVTSFLALEAVSADPPDTALPEPSSATALLAVAGLALWRRPRRWLAALAMAAAMFPLALPASAGQVDSVQFQDGKNLLVQSVYGTGADTAYLVIDFKNGDDYAWQFNWDPSTTINGWQMLEAIAHNSILTTSGVPGSTNLTNPAGDGNLTVTATYYSSFLEHYVTNMQYGPTTGVVDDWDFFTGTYNAALVSVSDPQGTTWTSPPVGIDAVDLTNNEFIGWVDVYPHTPQPVLPEAPLPPPAAAAGFLLGGALLWRSRRRAGAA